MNNREKNVGQLIAACTINAVAATVAANPLNVSGVIRTGGAPAGDFTITIDGAAQIHQNEVYSEAQVLGVGAANAMASTRINQLTATTWRVTVLQEAGAGPAFPSALANLNFDFALFRKARTWVP